MDLAEIRKKARSRQRPTPDATTGTEVPPVGNHSSASIQGEPPATSSTAGPMPLSVTLPMPCVPDELNAAIDPLDALFNGRSDLDLATEEHYLQNLMEGEQETTDGLLQWLTFTLGEEEYALDIGNIREIIKPREITDIPRVPGFILGIISLRGVVIPVFDLKQRLKLGSVEITPDSRIVVCERDDRCVGLLVDSITQVVRIPETGIEPPPSVLSGLDRDMVEGVGRHQGRMMIQLDLTNVLNAELV